MGVFAFETVERTAGDRNGSRARLVFETAVFGIAAGERIRMDGNAREGRRTRLKWFAFARA